MVFKTKELAFHLDSNKARMLKLKQQKFPRLFGCTNTHLCTHGHTTYNERGGGGKEGERKRREARTEIKRETNSAFHFL